jgi:hypothetical protein
MEYVGKKLAKFILYLIGWKPLLVPNEHIQNFKNNQRLVLTISHTSTWDGVIFMLYKIAYPEIFGKSVVVVKPQIFEAVPKPFHAFLNKLGLMKATAYENKNGGFVSATIETLRPKDEFLFIVSPKGKVANSPWRSGYYVIAKELGCKIMPCGLDYAKKQMIYFEPITIEHQTKEDIDQLVQSKLSEISPYKAENSEFSLHPSITSKNSLITFSFIILLLIVFLSYLSWNYKILFFAVLVLLFLLI